jgi:hypothetical protein
MGYTWRGVPLADDGYRTVRLREDFLGNIETFLNTAAAKKNNINSVADFIYRCCMPQLIGIEKEYGILIRKRVRGKLLEPLPGDN